MSFSPSSSSSVSKDEFEFIFLSIVSNVLPLQFFQQSKALRGFLGQVKKVNGESLVDSRKHSNLLFTAVAKGYAPLVPNVTDDDP